MYSEVKNYKGVPSLFINGEPATCHWCFCNPDHTEDFVKAGIRIFTISLPLFKEEQHWWTGTESYNFSRVTEILDEFINAAPDALFVPRFHLGLAERKWFAETFPEECNEARRLDNGQPDVEYRHPIIGKPQHSMASKKWREIAGRASVGFVETVEKHCGEKIIGYHIGGGFSGEWFTWHIVNENSIDDYSQPMRLAFREYLRLKYKDDGILQKAWKRKGLCIDSVEIPDVFRRMKPSLGSFYSTAVEQDIIDFQECLGHEEAVSCTGICRLVKDALKWKKIVGVFNGYFLVFNNALVPQRSGHLGFGDILDCDAIDFISSPYSYENRGFGQNHQAQTIACVVQSRGKLYVDEIDTMPGSTASEFNWIKYKYPPDTAGFCEMLKRDFAYNQSLGTAYWWMDLMYEGWYSPPEAIETLKKLIQAENCLRDYEKGSNTEIAVVLDPVSYMSAFPGPCHQERYISHLVHWEMARTGAPFDILFYDDFIKSARNYRLAIFPQVAMLDAQRATTLVQYLEKRKISSIWFHAPGYCFQDNSIQEITGWKWRYGDAGPADVAIRNTRHWLAEGVPDGFEYGANTGIEDYFRHGFNWEKEAVPAFKVIIDDDEADFIGAHVNGDGAGLASKERNGVFSILSSAPAMKSILLRNAAKKAGVHLYAPHGDIVYSGKCFLGISAGSDAERQVMLPQKSKVVDLQTGRVIGENIDRFTVELKYGYCGLYLTSPCG